jgi:large subunit ribosomal protein L4
MSQAPLYSKDGNQKGQIDLKDSIFEGAINERLLFLTSTAFAGNLRHGTHDTKTRREVRGGGRKPWRQKGTGRARHGSRRSPIWRGGGTVFGPHPRSYFTNLSVGMKRSALISALSLKNKEKNLMLLEDSNLTTARTKELATIVKALKLDEIRTLFIVSSADEKMKRASRNLKHTFSVKQASDVNAYHIVRRNKLLIDQKALELLEERALGASNVSEKENGSKG